MPSKPSVHQSSQRDLRIDFFRGIVLLIILVEHIEWQTGVNWLVQFAPHVIGPIDALDIFVFLSGYVFGLVYSRILERKGFWPCYRKALRRMVQLYIANNVIFLLVLAAISFFSLEQTSFVRNTHFSEATNQPIISSLLTFGLVYQPYNFDILPLYIVLLALMPVLLLLSRDWRVGLLISSILYTITQLHPAFNLPLVMTGKEKWIFNPFSWQFLFAFAMVLSSHRKHQIRKRLENQWILWLSVIVITVVTAAYQTSINYTGQSTHGVLPWIDKTTLGPLRLFYFLCFVRVVSFCLPESAMFWHTKIATPIVRCGQHSLPVFCLGILLTYTCIAWKEVANLGNLLTMAIELGAIGISVAFAFFTYAYNRKGKNLQL